MATVIAASGQEAVRMKAAALLNKQSQKQTKINDENTNEIADMAVENHATLSYEDSSSPAFQELLNALVVSHSISDSVHSFSRRLYDAVAKKL